MGRSGNNAAEADSPNESAAAIGKGTPITIGLVVLILSVSLGAVFKAGQVLTEFEYVKTGLTEMRGDIADIKKTISRVLPK